MSKQITLDWNAPRPLVLKINPRLYVICDALILKTLGILLKMWFIEFSMAY